MVEQSQTNWVPMALDYRPQTTTALASPVEFVKLWSYRLRIIQTQISLIDSKMLLELRFEDLISDPGSTLTKLCNFVELDISDRWLEHATSLIDESRFKGRANEYLQYFSNADIALNNGLGYSL